MRVSDLFRSNPAVQSQQNIQADEQELAKQQQQQAAAQALSDDSVSISPLARHYSQVSQILGEDEGQQAAKVASIKEQVDEGKYDVSKKDVAQAFMTFTRDTV